MHIQPFICYKILQIELLKDKKYEGYVTVPFVSNTYALLLFFGNIHCSCLINLHLPVMQFPDRYQDRVGKNYKATWVLTLFVWVHKHKVIKCKDNLLKKPLMKSIYLIMGQPFCLSSHEWHLILGNLVRLKLGCFLEY